ncbi:hypothetical protein NQZ68_035889 [Dissostichus eleginoides]|nr:hypothetical protein NQZ68_035889 [Dissostichus eleginoides]
MGAPLEELNNVEENQKSQKNINEPAQTPRQQQQDEAGPEDVTAGRENREERELENRQFLSATGDPSQGEEAS